MKLGLTGTNASGKTSVVNYLKSKGFKYFSLSDVIRSELTKRGLEHSRDNLRHIGNELRMKFGASVLADKIIIEICTPNAVIDSIRNVSEVTALQKLSDFKLIAIDAPIDVRFMRAKGRGRPENAEDIQAFKSVEDKEKSRKKTSQNIDQCIKMSDFHIYNDGSITSLHEKIEAIIREIGDNETKLG